MNGARGAVIVTLPAGGANHRTGASMTKAFDYDTFTTRNNGYVSSETQAKIRSTRLLIAGCGLGASTAICAARMGFPSSS